MSRARLVSRRSILRGLAAGGLLPLAGCSLDSRDPAVMSILDKAEILTEAAQRALLAPRLALAREYPPGAITPYFKPNGSIDPDDPDYVALSQRGFSDWRLEVGGLVERPMKLSAADCAPCRRARRSPGTTASRAGAASASGREPSSRPCSPSRA